MPPVPDASASPELVHYTKLTHSLDTRVSVLEERLQHVATREDMTTLTERMKRFATKESLATLQESIKGKAGKFWVVSTMLGIALAAVAAVAAVGNVMLRLLQD